MTYDDLRSQPAPLPSIDAVLTAHGVVAVLRASVVFLLRGRFPQPRPPDLRALNDHMARDIGLPPWGPDL